MSKNSSAQPISDLDQSGWSPVDTSGFSPNKLKKFKQRKRALDLCISSSNTHKQISSMTGLSISEIKRVRSRAFKVSDTGIAYGYLACIPNLNLAGYTKKSALSSGYAGKFTLFLGENPKIKKELDAIALGKSTASHVAIRGKYYKRIHTSFIKMCIEAGIDTTWEYPFSNHDKGLGAIRNYCIKLKEQHFSQGAKVDYGDNAGKLAQSSMMQVGNHKAYRPYDVVQLDGHKIDTELTVKLLDEIGDIQYLPLSRIWILALVDVSSRVVLGYSISLYINYTLQDVQECIASSFRNPSSEGTPGLPNTEIEECSNRIFDAIKLDNAYSHISAWLQESLIGFGVQEVVTNRPQRPRSNAIVERFFETFEETTTHQFPTTTGDNPKDPRKREPTRAAKKLVIQLEDIEVACQKAIERYNHCPHSSLNGRSPLEYLQFNINSHADFIRTISLYGHTTDFLFKRKFQVTIRGNKSQGHFPYIQFKCAKYTSTALRKSTDLIGRKATFETDITDIRTGKLFLDDGRFIDKLEVDKVWIAHKHSLKDRQTILKLARQKKINFDFSSPVPTFLEYLAERSLTSRKDRNAAIRVQRESGITSKAEIEETLSNKNKHEESLKEYKNKISINYISRR